MSQQSASPDPQPPNEPASLRSLESGGATDAVPKPASGTSVASERGDTLSDPALAAGIADQGSDPTHPKKKGLVVIHGVGQQRQSETLQFMGSPLIEWMRRWIEAHNQTIRVNQAVLRFGSDDNPLGEPTHVHVTLGDGTDGRPQIAGEDVIKPFDWTIAEAWWAGSNVAPPLTSIGIWLLSSYIRVFVGFWLAQCRHVGAVWDFLQKPNRPPFLALWLDAAITCVTILLAPFALPFGFAGVIVVMLLSKVPLASVQSFALLNPLTSFLTVNAGEMYILDNDEVQAANFRARLEHAIRWLRDEAQCEEIYVMAHSAGSIISYQTLCESGDLWIGEKDPPVVKLFTMGEGLNLAWRLQTARWWTGPHQWRLFQPLRAGIQWLDFWAGQDPAPSGNINLPKGARQAIDTVVQTLIRRHPDRRIELKLPKPEIPVTNWMDVLSDHGGYWNNDEEVLVRVACEIDAGKGHGWNQSRSFYNEHYCSTGSAARVGRVGWLTAIRLGFYVLAIAATFQPETQRVARDILSLFGNIPGVTGIATAVNAAIHDTVSTLALSPSTPLVGWIGWLFQALPALIVMVFLYVLLFMTAVRALWDQWDVRMRNARIYEAASTAAGAANTLAKKSAKTAWLKHLWLAGALVVLFATAAVGVLLLGDTFRTTALVLGIVGYGALPLASLVIWGIYTAFKPRSDRGSQSRKETETVTADVGARAMASDT